MGREGLSKYSKKNNMYQFHFYFDNVEKACKYDRKANALLKLSGEKIKGAEGVGFIKNESDLRLFVGRLFKQLYPSLTKTLSPIEVVKYFNFNCNGTRNLIDYLVENNVFNRSNNANVVEKHLNVRCSIRGALRGGKGGFGSLLKQQGRKAGKKKVTDFGACRDLNGRRLRHVNDEIRLRKFRQFHNQARQELDKNGGSNNKKMEKQIKKKALKDFEQFEKNASSGIGGWHTAVPKWGQDFGNSFSKLKGGDKKKQKKDGDTTTAETGDVHISKKRNAQMAAIESYASGANGESDSISNAVMADSSQEDCAKTEPENNNNSNVLVLTCLRGQIGLGNTGEVQGLSNYGSAGVAWVTLSKGQWYYEVELLSDGIMQIGWCDTLFIGDDNEGDGVGDDLHSWGYDGNRQKFWHGKSYPFGDEKQQWKTGDVIGCYVDLDEHSMVFYVNGVEIGGKVPCLNDTGFQYEDGLYPALSLEAGNVVRVNVGQRSFKYDVKQLTSKHYTIKNDAIKSVWESRHDKK
eukprot:g1747.t1